MTRPRVRRPTALLLTGAAYGAYVKTTARQAAELDWSHPEAGQPERFAVA